MIKSMYSDLPNNHAANLINFLGKKHLHNLIRTYTFINFWDFSFKTWFSPTELRKNPSYTAILRPMYTFIDFWESEKSATYTIKWSYTIIWQVRVVLIPKKNICKRQNACKFFLSKWNPAIIQNWGCGGQGSYFQPKTSVISQISAPHECANIVFMT